MRYMGVVTFRVLVTLIPGKQAWCPLNGRLGGPLSYSGRFGEEERVFSPPGCDHRIVRPVASHYTELSQIHWQQMLIFRNTMQTKAVTVHVDACK